MARRDEIDQRLEELVLDFGRYLDTYDDIQPFGQPISHLAPIRRLREVGGAANAVRDVEFQRLLWNTLHAFGLDTRASRLAPYDEFASVLGSTAPLVAALDGIRIDDADLDHVATEERIWEVVEAASGVTDNKAKVVAASKAIHHVLPELVIPIDRWYTGWFFRWYGNEFQYDQRRLFRRTWTSLADVARRVHSSQYVGEGWRSSAAKIVDNAVVGYSLIGLASAPRTVDITPVQVFLESFAEERDWDKFHSPKNLAMALAAESGELLEIFQWLTDEESRSLSADDASRVSEELADIQIYLARLADVLSVDMDQAVREKIEKNAANYPVQASKGNAVKYSRRKE